MSKPSATLARCPRRYPPTQVTTRQGPLMNSRPWEWTHSSHRTRPATARQYRWLPRGRIPANLSARDRMRRKLRTKRGRQRYGLRKQTVEPVFGQIKQGRGLRQFLLRSLEKVNREWLLICTGHNLLKLFRFGGWLGAPKLAGHHRKLAPANGCSPAGRRPEDGRLCQDRMLRPARMVAITWHWLNTRYLRIPRGC